MKKILEKYPIGPYVCRTIYFGKLYNAITSTEIALRGNLIPTIFTSNFKNNEQSVS
jgi:hypothetical protein